MSHKIECWDLLTLSTSDVFKFSSFVQNREVVEESTIAAVFFSQAQAVNDATITEYLVATVDGFGIVVETIYVILFLIYAPKVTRGRTLILAVILDVAISTVAVVTTQLALQREARGGVVGVMGAGLNIVMYFSPLSAMETIRLPLLFSIYPTLTDFGNGSKSFEIRI
ncbi:hypothetical protein JHK85_027890 [Glycine max]|nr:hypothetical protein JHK85_027890 [Glycine max]